MAITQDSQLIFKILSKLTSGLDLTSTVDNGAQDWSLNFGHGTGAGQATMVWSDTRTLSASGTENIDFAGALASAFGATLTFTSISAIFVRASKANTNSVLVQRASSNGVPAFLAASDGVTLTPGGLFALIDPSAAGIAVTAGTGDLLTITNGAGGSSVDYDIVVIGRA